MIELTPLDVRKKKGDFRRGIRGYEPAQVDDFLDTVADRFEAVVREAAALQERVARLEQQVADYRDREKALTEALVTAQQMREDIKSQSTREVELIRRNAEQEAERIKADAVKTREREEAALVGLRERQLQFLTSYRAFLEQELSDLNAIARGVEAHGAGAAAPARSRGSAPAAETRTEPVTPVPPAPQAARARAATTESPMNGTRATGPAAPARKDPPPARSGRRGPHSDPGAEDEIEAQLAQALARWEPELEAAKPAAPRAEPEPAPAAEEEDELDLLLSDDDVVPPASASVAPAPASPPREAPPPRAPLDLEDELDPELAELLGPDPGEPDLSRRRGKSKNPPSKAEREKLEGEVKAALGEPSGSLIDLDEAFGHGPTSDARGEELEAVFDDAFGDGTPANTPAAPRAGRDAFGSPDRSPRGDGDSDMAGLTLHPMFFEQDGPALPGLNESRDSGKDKRRDRWSLGDER